MKKPLITSIGLAVCLALGIYIGTQINSADAKKEPGMKIVLTSVLVDDPVKAHGFYTDVLGFESMEYDPDAGLAVVVSPADPEGTALLLKPRGDSFARDFQEQCYESGLPVIVFGVNDLAAEVERLKDSGVRFRDDLAREEWGLDNLFEDTAGNIIMLQEEK